jgi:nicotinamidase-related amidase
MKKVLVVVDVQKDFYHPDGALYVKGGEVLPERITKVIPEFDYVIFTVDWHPYNHCSFKENGGIWPVHCVAYTEGASLPKEFMPYFKEIHDNTCFNIIMKGMNSQKEEYGADPIMIMCSHDENPEECEFVFSGIAGDYCVKETIKNFIEEYPTIKVSVYLDGVASIDDGTTIREFMKENNIEEWKPQE